MIKRVLTFSFSRALTPIHAAAGSSTQEFFGVWAGRAQELLGRGEHWGASIGSWFYPGLGMAVGNPYCP